MCTYAWIGVDVSRFDWSCEELVKVLVGSVWFHHILRHDPIMFSECGVYRLSMCVCYILQYLNACGTYILVTMAVNWDILRVMENPGDQLKMYFAIMKAMTNNFR